jgi:hypothetical protein
MGSESSSFAEDAPMAERGFFLGGGDSDEDEAKASPCEAGVSSGGDRWALVSPEEAAGRRVSQPSKLTFRLRLPFERCFRMISAAFSTSPSV